MAARKVPINSVKKKSSEKKGAAERCPRDRSRSTDASRCFKLSRDCVVCKEKSVGVENWPTHRFLAWLKIDGPRRCLRFSRFG